MVVGRKTEMGQCWSTKALEHRVGALFSASGIFLTRRRVWILLFSHTAESGEASKGHSAVLCRCRHRHCCRGRRQTPDSSTNGLTASTLTKRPCPLLCWCMIWGSFSHLKNLLFWPLRTYEFCQFLQDFRISPFQGPKGHPSKSTTADRFFFSFFASLVTANEHWWAVIAVRKRRGEYLYCRRRYYTVQKHTRSVSCSDSRLIQNKARNQSWFGKPRASSAPATADCFVLCWCTGESVWSEHAQSKFQVNSKKISWSMCSYLSCVKPQAQFKICQNQMIFTWFCIFELSGRYL